MSYPAISLATATVGRHRCPQKRLQTARQPPVYPNSSPDHRACNSLTPFRCPHAVHPCPSVDLGLHYRGDRGGSIPACAGEPGWASPPQVLQPVYPRVCGGTPPPDRLRGDQQGLSPRVRGNRARPIAECVYTGSIPACAGEPPGASPNHPSVRIWRSIPACAGEPPMCQMVTTIWRVYPRYFRGFPRLLSPGLSPRVRGNPRPTTM